MSRSLKGRKVIPQPKLLVVDDRTENLKACKALLSCSGYEIDTASSGNEALRKLLVDEYFCILLDINMPEMDGIETAKLIRRDPCFQTLPIIFVTAHNFDDKMINEAYAVGAIDYIEKPLNEMMLRSKVNFFLELWSQKQKLLASDELAKVNEKLKKSNHDLNHFAFIVSHDLQAPVRHILILSRLILEEESGGLGEEARKLLALLGKSAEQLQGMITDILAFSRAAKKVKLNKVDGNEVISRVLGDLEIDITAKNAKVAVNSVPTDLYTSDNLLYQLFCNLITNALKFCVDRSPKISISCQEEARVYRFSVSDNGPGIDPGSKDDIFQLFHRLPSAKSIPGTGLGLAICRKIVEAMGGDIRFESELGKGTTFYFTVRRVPQALAGGSSTAGNPEKAA